jgi:hypothetical protein
MIVAHQDTADCCASSSPSTPLHLRCKPLRGFGGVTARLSRAKDGHHVLQGNPYTLRSQRKEELLSRVD